MLKNPAVPSYKHAAWIFIPPLNTVKAGVLKGLNVSVPTAGAVVVILLQTAPDPQSTT
jgi:hypothetical protein